MKTERLFMLINFELLISHKQTLIQKESVITHSASFR